MLSSIRAVSDDDGIELKWRRESFVLFMRKWDETDVL
jgi:hypothetical protein